MPGSCQAVSSAAAARPGPAITDWLATDEGSAFTTRRDLELYGVTSHPHGWLQRTLMAENTRLLAGQEGAPRGG
ncbi:MAG: hypothetical protein JF621_07885 [Streptomyces turgidiscabies]|nr:hypothetical protein [Streptomyces turgidiscabies]